VSAATVAGAPLALMGVSSNGTTSPHPLAGRRLANDPLGHTTVKSAPKGTPYDSIAIAHGIAGSRS